VGDVVLEVNRKPIKSLADYNAALVAARKGFPLLLLLKRGDQSRYASLER